MKNLTFVLGLVAGFAFRALCPQEAPAVTADPTKRTETEDRVAGAESADAEDTEAPDSSGDPSAGDRAPSLEERLGQLEREIDAERRRGDDLRRQIEVLERRQFELEPADLYTEEGDAEGEAASGDKFAEKSAGLRDRYGPGKGGVYSKPFLESVTRKTYLGGYLDLEFVDRQGENGSFVQHRFIPLIYADVTDRLTVAAEIEFEYGGPDSGGDDGEIKLEFATMDYVFHEAFGFRAGALLVPLGKFNLIHDSPVNDLTDRPLVNRAVIPTTLTEAGLGFFGTFYPVDPFALSEGLEVDLEVSYEAYLVNGFRGLVEDENAPTGYRSLFSESRGLRTGRSSLKIDNNDAISGVGRVAVSPFLGTEVGASVHAGPYDDRGDNMLVVYAVDAMVNLGRFASPLAGLELQGEFARAEISRDSLARASGVPDDMWGFYLQANYHFMPRWLVDNVGIVFDTESTFTAVVRLDQIELGSTPSERVTFGLNFRPMEETVFKFDYQFNFEDWNHRTVDNDAFLFSVATYF